jgi:segregation and condensation protein A
MKNSQSDIFKLTNFEGPLEFLLYLIQKDEIEIYDIPIYQIIEQFISLQTNDIDKGAEFVSATAALHWLKSKFLLPKHEQLVLEEGDPDPKFEIIHQLLEYCRYKQAAKDLGKLEMRQGLHYYRGGDGVPEIKKNLGISHLSLDELATLFRQVLARASRQKETIHGEIWKVSDKIEAIRSLLKQEEHLPFNQLFAFTMSREELIVTFLALLELIKLGEIKVHVHGVQCSLKSERVQI